MNRLRGVLSADDLAAAWADGRGLSREAAVSAALAIGVDACLDDAERASDQHGLTRREFEILRLIATGHSNHEIAQGLFISYATVARHVANLFSKIGIDSRSKATVYAYQHGIV